MTIYLINGNKFENMDIIRQTDIFCVVVDSEVKGNGNEDTIEENSIVIPWTSILYIR